MSSNSLDDARLFSFFLFLEGRRRQGWLVGSKLREDFGKSSGARVDKEGLEGTSDMRHLNGFLGFGMISCAKKGGCS